MDLLEKSRQYLSDVLTHIKTSDATKIADGLGFKTFYDVLSFPPHTYTNTALLKNLAPNVKGALRVHITQGAQKSYKRLPYVKISASMLDFNKMVELIIFHPKNFMLTPYKYGAELIIYGKLELFKEHYKLVQPKILKTAGSIELGFKLKGKNKDFMNELIGHINTNVMRELGIEEKYASALQTIFHPDEEFVNYFGMNGFSGIYKDALAFVEIFTHLLRLSRKKLNFNANFQCEGKIDDFIHSLPFTLTSGQKNAIQEISADLASPLASRRLVMGDVGCGKTIIILASVMMAYPKKSILMAPTSILATQLYEQACKFLPRHINISLITSKNELDSRLSTDKDSDFTLQAEDINNAKLESSQSADFIIGTQALLFREFDLSNFALVMSDEQHRFGANQRSKLEKMFASKTTRPHILQFSATPIPRTLSMINTNYIKQTIIKDLPFEKDITTYIIEKSDFGKLFAHIKNEVALKRQVAIIYPLVDESEHIKYSSLKEGQAFWRKHFEHVFVTSGRDEDKQEVMSEFERNGEVLLSTTMIEVGISLPRLSSIVIVAPERLGLATLHQLRGRVSRNGLKGYCFLYINDITQSARERLENFAATLDGFIIAELDLKNRQGGDLINGYRQSGKAFTYYEFEENITQEALNCIKASE